MLTQCCLKEEIYDAHGLSQRFVAEYQHRGCVLVFKRVRGQNTKACRWCSPKHWKNKGKAKHQAVVFVVRAHAFYQTLESAHSYLIHRMLCSVLSSCKQFCLSSERHPHTALVFIFWELHPFLLHFGESYPPLAGGEASLRRLPGNV